MGHGDSRGTMSPSILGQSTQKCSDRSKITEDRPARRAQQSASSLAMDTFRRDVRQLDCVYDRSLAALSTLSPQCMYLYTHICTFIRSTYVPVRLRLHGRMCSTCIYVHCTSSTPGTALSNQDHLIVIKNPMSPKYYTRTSMLARRNKQCSKRKKKGT